MSPIPNPENVFDTQLPFAAGHLMYCTMWRRQSLNRRTAREGFGMTGKSALYGLAVVALTGAMAVAALADDHDVSKYGYGPANSSVSSDVGASRANAKASQPQEDSWNLREAMETGALPGSPVALSERSNLSGHAPALKGGGISFRPGIDNGP